MNPQIAMAIGCWLVHYVVRGHTIYTQKAKRRNTLTGRVGSIAPMYWCFVNRITCNCVSDFDMTSVAVKHSRAQTATRLLITEVQIHLRTDRRCHSNWFSFLFFSFRPETIHWYLHTHSSECIPASACVRCASVTGNFDAEY